VQVIAGIEGVLKSTTDDGVVIDSHGISFRVYSPASTLSIIGSPGERVFLHTYLHVKEDSLALYGFASAEERRMFEMLIGVSGIGPKLALSVLSVLNPERLSLAIASGDQDLLNSISGVGKKTAARLILELKGKFEQPEAGVPFPHEDLRAALISLGYSAAEVAGALADIPNDPDLALEEKVRLALRKFAQAA
jgi:holliday junction DNA helicase RuvA